MRIILTILFASFVILSIALGAGCSSEEASLYSAEQANTRIYGAFAAMNQLCGANRAPAVPVFSDARKDDVNQCVAAILATNCATWQSETTEIPICLAIQLNL